MTEAGFQVEPMPSPDRNRIAAYARASGDMNPLHLDPEIARKVGFSDVIAHGMLVMGLALSTLRRAVSGGIVTTSRVRFAAPVLVDTVLTLKFREAGDNIEFEVIGDDVTVISGKATIGRD